jgi:hypothetical protein
MKSRKVKEWLDLIPSPSGKIALKRQIEQSLKRFISDDNGDEEEYNGVLGILWEQPYESFTEMVDCNITFGLYSYEANMKLQQICSLMDMLAESEDKKMSLTAIQKLSREKVNLN